MSDSKKTKIVDTDRFHAFAERTYHKAAKEFRNKPSSCWPEERARYLQLIRLESTETLEWLAQSHVDNSMPRGEDSFQTILDELADRILMGIEYGQREQNQSDNECLLSGSTDGGSR